MALQLETTFDNGVVGEYWVLTKLYFRTSNVSATFWVGVGQLDCWKDSTAFAAGKTAISLSRKFAWFPIGFTAAKIRTGSGDLVDMAEHYCISGMGTPPIPVCDGFFESATQVA